jgi:hypothetical protein
MSYDLYFWREDRNQKQPADAICERLVADEDLDGIAKLSVANLKAQFTKAFPEIIDNGTDLTWEGEGSYFQVTWSISSQPGYTLCVMISCGFPLLDHSETMNQLIDVGNQLGCALYDPQTGERYPQPA